MSGGASFFVLHDACVHVSFRQCWRNSILRAYNRHCPSALPFRPECIDCCYFMFSIFIDGDGVLRDIFPCLDSSAVTLFFALFHCFMHETSDVDVFIANYHRPKKITLQISLKSTICRIIEIAVFQFK